MTDAMRLSTTRLFGALEKVFVISAFILYSGALLTLLRQMTGAISNPNQSDPVSQLVFFLVYGITACLVLVWRERFTRIDTGDVLLWLLVVIALASVLWSAAPEITLRRSIALLGTTLFGVYLAIRFSLREQLRLLAWALGIAALLSLLFVLALPAYGIMNEPEAQGWRGVYTHKNAFGRSMVLGVLAFMLLALSERRYAWIKWVGFSLSVLLLLLSNAKTALVMLVTLLILLPLYRASRWPFTLVVPFLIAAVLTLGSLALIVVFHEQTILGLLNRDITLTGRTEVWSAVVDMIWKQPWLGYGYDAFWLGWGGPSAYVLLVAYFDPLSAHNGLLDLWLDLGLLGVVVFALGFLLASVRAVMWARLTKGKEDLWPLAYLTYMFLYSVTESAILTRNSIVWVLYVTVVLMLHNRTRLPRGMTAVSAPASFKESGRAVR
jgi:exopolysaccharide production protein ExoQ